MSLGLFQASPSFFKISRTKLAISYNNLRVVLIYISLSLMPQIIIFLANIFDNILVCTLFLNDDFVNAFFFLYNL